jgi:hypothetical protein
MITFCNHSASIFVINLMEEFNNVIGLKSPTERGPSFLGIRVR